MRHDEEDEKIECDACGLPTSVDEDGLCNECSDLADEGELE